MPSICNGKNMRSDVYLLLSLSATSDTGLRELERRF